MFIPLLIAAVVGYLLGSLPFGYLVARAKGVNIFEVGSKNPGATNVRRVLGNGPGNLVFGLDALKGALATGWPWLWLAGQWLINGHTRPWKFDPSFFVFPEMLVGLIASMLGHAFSCFTKFRGGKGVATGAGGFFVLFPVGALIAAVVWGLTAALTRYASLASMLAGVALTVAAWKLHQPPLLMGVSLIVTVFVIARHRANIARLLAGTESRIGQPPLSPT